jgi:hypothetical protein
MVASLNSLGETAHANLNHPAYLSVALPCVLFGVTIYCSSIALRIYIDGTEVINVAIMAAGGLIGFAGTYFMHRALMRNRQRKLEAVHADRREEREREFQRKLTEAKTKALSKAARKRIEESHV